jgi:hypothetical protein
LSTAPTTRERLKCIKYLINTKQIKIKYIKNKATSIIQRKAILKGKRISIKIINKLAYAIASIGRGLNTTLLFTVKMKRSIIDLDGTQRLTVSMIERAAVYCVVKIMKNKCIIKMMMSGIKYSQFLNILESSHNCEKSHIDTIDCNINLHILYIFKFFGICRCKIFPGD